MSDAPESHDVRRPTAEQADHEPQDDIVIVTGLPRSGTSLMMQMLEAGGIEAFTDRKRRADEDNPRGYLEHEAIKSLRKDSSWIASCRGKALKVIVQLVPHLPRCAYRFLHMERPLREVLRSQGVMLERLEKKGARLSEEQLKTAFRAQAAAAQAWIAARNYPVLKVDYRHCIESPESVAASVNQHLGGRLDEARMVSTVDASLYRNRA